MVDLFDAAGITGEYLIRFHKKELKAKKTEFIKLKGAVNPANLGKGQSIIATSGIIEQDKDGEWYGTGDTVIAVQVADLGIRQKGLNEVHKLRGDYPADKQKHEVTGPNGGPILTKAVDLTDDELLNIAAGRIGGVAETAQSPK